MDLNWTPWTALIVWGAAVLLVVLLLQASNQRRKERHSGLYIIFFFSGFPALIYQIVWERALFAVYGVNIESVTIVVTAFMLGLGLGSLLGGQLSRSKQIPLLTVLGFVELGVAAYGFLSLRLFHWVALFTAGASVAKTSVLAFALLLFPTLLMGSTLPLLVAHMVRLSNNVGHSVGKLYFVNTLGSAMACFVAAALMMRALGQSGSVLVAALMNLGTGSAVLLLYRNHAKTDHAAFLPVNKKEPDFLVPTVGNISFPLALAVVALTGFIALGYEILWYRMFSFVTSGQARSFAVLLGSYLGGIALGSFAAEKICRKYADKRARDWMTLVALFVILANLAGFLVVPFLANTSRWLNYNYVLPLIGLAAALLGAVFPLIAHAAILPDSDTGAKLGYLYLANILGSASGSFLVGFILMDYWPFSRIALALALLGVAAGALLLGRMPMPKLVPALSGCVAVALVLTLLTGPLFDHLYEKLYYKTMWNPRAASSFQDFQRVVETKSGVVAVSPKGLVIGDGSMEARLSTDLRNNDNVNFLVPPFAISSFNRNFKRVLMIGLGTGVWAEIIANHSQLGQMIVVEINPGYLRLIPQYPQVSEVLKNPKVEIVIDDARRWLWRNPEEKFDLIVMNTTAHWRDHVSGLLSVEFDQLVQKHLNPGGTFLYNTTFSPRALLTGATVFPYALRVRNCLVASDSPIAVDKERWRNELTQYKLEGKPVFNMTVPQDRELLERLLSLADSQGPTTSWNAMENADSLRQRYRGWPLITDDNMGDEWF